MHYESTAFAIDRNVPTIYAKNGGVLGNSKGFSPVRYPFELTIMSPPPIHPLCAVFHLQIDSYFFLLDWHNETEPPVQMSVKQFDDDR